MLDFPSPYAASSEQEADRALCWEIGTAAAQEVGEGGFSARFFDLVGDGQFAFLPWVLKYRDELARRYESQDQVDARVRFQLADLFCVAEREDKSLPLDLIAATGALIRTVPLFSDGDRVDERSP